MTDSSPELGCGKNEFLDVGMCIANTLGLAKTGKLTDEEVDKLVASRDSVGKGNRSRYGRLLCEYESCDVRCNVELVDGVPIEKGLGQLMGMLDGCVVFRQTTIGPDDTQA